MATSLSLAESLALRLGAELIETHISWVLLTGERAYKLKKPVRLPFVDYSTPGRRQQCCEEEVRLNRRLAPGLYLGVSRITGSVEAPAIDGDGPVVDWAVRMRRFPQQALFSERAARGTLDEASVDQLAGRLAAFHAGARVHAPSGPGLRERSIAALAGASGLFPEHQQRELALWIEREASTVLPLWTTRAAAGRVRDGHGDLHLANILALDGEVMAFDCIEFDPALRRIDVVEDMAFTCMDLLAHGQPRLAWRFLDGWLERTGDFEGVPGLRLCAVYRALVRAMAHHLREPGSTQARGYAAEALHWTQARAPRLTITHGLPGSGKTFASQRLLEAEGAIRVRSDVERKRLHGLAPLQRSGARRVEVYAPESTRRTYERLLALARMLLRSGWPVVLDAAFLQRQERQQAHALAGELGVPFAVLACEAPLPLLRERLQSRSGDASEADAQVLEQLQAAAQPLGPEERAWVRPPPG